MQVTEQPRPDRDDSTAPDDGTARSAVHRCVERLYRRGLTTACGGNVSVRLPDGDLLITPTGLDKGSLSVDDVVRVRADGTPAKGPAPSSELPLHLAVYRARPDLGAIVHAHPQALTAFAVANRAPPTRLLHPVWRVCGDVGLAPNRPPGSAELAAATADRFRTGASCVLLANHGAVTAGADLDEAFARLEALELAAQSIARARRLRRRLRPVPDAELRLGTGSAAADAPWEADRLAAREAVIAFARRAYRQHLVSSADGTLSVRVSAEAFAIAGPGGDRSRATADDAVLAAVEAPHGGPAALHAAIYRQHPDVGAVASAAPVSTAAFAVARAAPDTRTTCEGRTVLGEPTLVPFALVAHDPAAVAALLSPERPTLLVESAGAVVAGRDLLEALTRLEVLESTCAALLEATALAVPVSLLVGAS